MRVGFKNKPARNPLQLKPLVNVLHKITHDLHTVCTELAHEAHRTYRSFLNKVEKGLNFDRVTMQNSY